MRKNKQMKFTVPRRWRIPLGLLLISALAYAPLIGSLGYYWDDWAAVLTLSTKTSFWTFFAFNRPLSAWTYEIVRPLLGMRPLESVS